MPGFYTHYLCGQKFFKKLDNVELKDLISKNQEAFNLGAQGPDIFFFHLYRPWSLKRINKYGRLLHSERTGDFFNSAIKQAEKAAEGERETIWAYLSGFACHYALDFITHPYVYYKTGFIRKGEKKTSRYSIYHVRFETAIDYLMLLREEAVVPTQMRGWSLIDVGKPAATTIGRLYSRAFKEVFGIDLKINGAVGAIYDMRLIYRLLSDKSGRKKKFFTFLSHVTGINNAAFELIHPLELNDNTDYLNMDRDTWFTPWNGHCEHHESFPELFDLAVAEADDLCRMLYLFLKKDISIADCLARFGNRGFSTGLDCTLEPAFEFFSCIYESRRNAF